MKPAECLTGDAPACGCWNCEHPDEPKTCTESECVCCGLPMEEAFDCPNHCQCLCHPENSVGKKSKEEILLFALKKAVEDIKWLERFYGWKTKHPNVELLEDIIKKAS